MPYGKGTNTTFVPFDPPITLQEYVDVRNEIWRAKSVNELTVWTDFPAPFNAWKFTNIWRELDRTTAYVIDQVLPRWPDESCEQVLEVAAFRSMGKIETDQAIVREFGSWYDAVDAGWTAMYAALPEKPLTNAYSRLVGIQKALHAGPIIQRRNLHHQAAVWLAHGEFDKAYASLAVGTYLGMFGATQVILDLTWRGGHLPAWTPSTIGPGAAHGLGLVLGRTCTTRARGNVDTDPTTFTWDELRSLALDVVVKDAPKLGWLPAPFEVRELENVLCEYSRACRMLHFGKVPTMRRYKPNREPFELPLGWSR